MNPLRRLLALLFEPRPRANEPTRVCPTLAQDVPPAELHLVPPPLSPLLGCELTASAARLPWLALALPPRLPKVVWGSPRPQAVISVILADLRKARPS